MATPKPQHTTCPDRRGEINLFAVEFFVMLIGKQVRRDVHDFHRRADDAVATHAEFKAIPKRGMTPENTG